jgi:hypothetical protein
VTTSTVIADVRLFARGCDLSWQSNSIEVAGKRDAKDATTFRSAGWKEVTAGLAAADIKASGLAHFGAAGTVDHDAWSQLGQVDALTFSDGDAVAGNLAYLTKVLRGEYKIGGKVGDLVEWEASMPSAWPVARGAYLIGPGTVVTDDLNSTAVQLGSMAAGQRLYATLHVVSVTGSAPTLDVTIQSDSNQTFTGSPETRLTFTQATAVTGEAVRTAAGAHADTWYRAVINCSEVGDESFMVAVAAGIY